MSYTGLGQTMVPAGTPCPSGMIRPDAGWTPIIGANQCVPTNWNPTDAQIQAWMTLRANASAGHPATLDQYLGTVRWGVVAVWGASIVASAIHGYKRHNGSVGAAIGWGVMGGVVPVITPIVALAEGYGQPLPVTANRRRRSRRGAAHRRSRR